MTTPAWHNLDIPEVYEQLRAHPEGLTEAEVSDRLAQTGRNEITRRKPISPWRLLFKQFANLFHFCPALCSHPGLYGQLPSRGKADAG